MKILFPLSTTTMKHYSCLHKFLPWISPLLVTQFSFMHEQYFAFLKLTFLPMGGGVSS